MLKYFLIILSVVQIVACKSNKLDCPQVSKKYQSFYNKITLSGDSILFTGSPAVSAIMYTKSYRNTERKYIIHARDNDIYGNYFEFIDNKPIEYIFYLGNENKASYKLNFGTAQGVSVEYGNPFVDRISVGSDSVFQLISILTYDKILLYKVEDETSVQIPIEESVYMPYVYSCKLPKNFKSGIELRLDCYRDETIIDTFIKQ